LSNLSKLKNLREFAEAVDLKENDWELRILLDYPGLDS
jgi:hypothetical protein